jgi:uncharacterized protein YutE (UPF0331/DUF86 family)
MPTPLDATLDGRFVELRAQQFAAHTPFWAYDPQVAHEWLVASLNIIGIVTSQRGVHWEQASAVMTDEHLPTGVPMKCIARMRGVLAATDEDRKRGLLGRIEYTIFAEAFDDFLDHAATFHKAGKVQESAILAAAVLEDSLKKVASKHGVATADSLDPTIDTLVTGGVFTPVYAKRLKALSGTRNSAFHARWDELTIQDVGAMITGIRELVDTYLD